MSLWGNLDQANNAPKSADAGGLGVSANGQAMYANTTANVFVSGLTVGVFGVDVNEQQVVETTKGGHAGWVLRKEGSGGRAGRVHVETLVAMGSMTGDGADDTLYADVIITITEQPQDETVVDGDAANFAVDYVLSNETTSVEIQWQVSVNGGGAWSDISGETGFDIQIASTDPEYIDGNQFRAVVSGGGASVTSDVAELTITAE